MSALRQLLDHRGQIGPYGLALDKAVLGELDHVKQAELDQAAAALEAEGPSDRLPTPDRLIDEKSRAVKPSDAGDVTFRQIRKQRLVERPRILAAVGGTARPPDHVMPYVGREGRKDARHVVAGFEAEVLVDLPIHLCRGQRHGRGLLLIQRSYNEIAVSCQDQCFMDGRDRDSASTVGGAL